MRHRQLLSVILLVSFVLVAQANAAQQIENEFYTVRVEGDGGVTIQSKAGGPAFFAGKLAEAGGTVQAADATDKTFGKGRVIEVRHENGNRDTIALYPAVPFVLFSAVAANGGAEPVVLNRIPRVSGKLDLGKPADSLKTLGTGGLLDPAKNPGSYAFLAVADPETRRGVVGGWLTHDRGDGVVFSPVEGATVRLEARAEYGRLRIKPKQEAALETFALGCFDDARLGLEAYADAIAKIYSVKLLPPKPGYCTWYMEKHSRACDETHLLELSAYAAKHLKPFGLDFIQIDDGWQIGGRNFTDYNPRGAYPSGMKAMADKIASLGLTPGIWFIPFAGSAKDAYVKNHQDWFAKDPQGKPYEARWGGTCLDLTNPATQEHVRTIVNRIGRQWGYKVFKLDGFWTGSATKLTYVNNGYVEDDLGAASFYNPDKTNIEALRDGMKLVRKTAGPEVFMLGCCVSQNMRSFGGSMGLVDAMRVGPDTGAGHIGAPHASRLWFLSGRVWWNDPDCVSVRASTPLERARLNASFTCIAGDLFYNSDWMPDFTPERLDILRRCMPNHGLFSRPVDVFEIEPARVWHLPDTREQARRDIVALYNWDKKPATVACPAVRIGLPSAKQYVGYEFWTNKFLPPFQDTLKMDLPAGSCRILSVRPVSENPQLLSTSRHITQGLVDVTGETWDASAKTLSALSKVVGGDPYELRILVPASEKSWRATKITLSADDQAAGVKADLKQDGPRLRAKIISPVSRDVKWAVLFEPAAVAAATPPPVANLKAQAEYSSVTLAWDDNGADRYRIARNDGASFETAVAGLVDTTVDHGKTYQYSVSAIGWSGTPGPVATVEAKTPAQLTRPADPPLPTVYLDELKPIAAKSGFGAPGIGKSAVGKTLSIEGKKYNKGLGLHAPARAVYAVPAGAKRFVAVVGLDDTKRDERSSIVFEIYGDVKEMGEKPVLLGQSPLLTSKGAKSWAFDIELNTRYRELQLVVTEGGDGNKADHADFVNAGFLTGEGKKK